jgi:putative FmdB family regulatory protein
MPIYEYVCEKCGHKFEKLVRSMNSTETFACPKCSAKKTQRQFSAFAVGADSAPSSTGGHAAGCGCCSARSSCPNAA